MLTTYIIGSLALIVKPGPDLTCTIATAVLLLAAFIILSRVAPGFVDSLLYSPEELQIINHLQDIPESSLNQ